LSLQIRANAPGPFLRSAIRPFPAASKENRKYCLSPSAFYANITEMHGFFAHTVKKWLAFIDIIAFASQEKDQFPAGSRA